MNLRSLRDSQKRDRRIAILWKGMAEKVRKPCQSKSIFVLGAQRSGTTMLMYAFHRHPKFFVYDEHKSSIAFRDHRLRESNIIENIIKNSGFSAVCFKPICDSHLVDELSVSFPEAHFVWIYRDYLDVANSSLRKFPHATRAIRLVCEGRPGGGWLQEGISDDMLCTLRDLYQPDLSDIELCCLVWWARNQVVVNSSLLKSPRLSVVKYEAIVTEPTILLPLLFDRMEIPFHPRVTSRIHALSIRKDPSVSVSLSIKSLCDDLMSRLDDVFTGSFFPSFDRTP